MVAAVMYKESPTFRRFRSDQFWHDAESLAVVAAPSFI